MKERGQGPHHQDLIGGQITEKAVSITEPTQVPNLKPNELQIIQLLHQTREKGKEASRKEIAEHLYPQENFQIASIRVGGDLHGANRKLKAFGWRIDNPQHYSQGKVRKIRGRYIITRQDDVLEDPPSKSGKKHEVLGKEPNPNKRGIKKRSRNSIPMLPHTQAIKLLPTSATLWKSQEIRKRLEIEKLEELRQKFKLDITLSVLSLIRANEVRKLEEIGKDYTRGRHTYGTSFDSVIGIGSKDDRQTKERKTKEFVITAVNETLDRLWGKQSKLVSIPKERQILAICMELEETGKTIQDIKNALSENLGVDLAEGPNLTSSQAPQFPKDTTHS